MSQQQAFGERGRFIVSVFMDDTYLEGFSINNRTHHVCDSYFSLWSFQDGWQKQDIKRTLKLHYRNFVAPDISEEAAEIQEYIITLESLPKATMLDLFQMR
ncbi:hypothetical protein ACFE04_020358 [Oxalis oulophora]